MTQTEMAAPRFNGVHSCNIVPQTGDTIVRFKGEDGRLYAITLNAAIVAPTVAAILGLNRHRRAEDASRQHADAQPVSLSGVRMFRLPDGRMGLTLFLEGGLELPVLIHPAYGPDLRKSVDEFLASASASPPPTH
jgi:hypothetical protein